MSILDPILAPIKAKARLIGFVVGGGALVALGLLAWYFWTDYKKVQNDLATTQNELVQKKAENKNLSDTVKTQASSKKVDDDVQAAVDNGVKAVEKTTTTIAETHSRNVKQIEAKYDKLPDTTDNNKAREDEISKDRVQRLWEVYCIANPDHERCLPKAASAASK
jgi:seryl-tRNA synthetase